MPSASSVSSSSIGGRAAGGDLLAGVAVEDPAHHGPRELALVLRAHRRQAVGGVLAALAGEDLGDLFAQGAYELLVHRASPYPAVA